MLYNKKIITIISLCITFICLSNHSYSIKRRATFENSLESKKKCQTNRFNANELNDNFHDYFDVSFKKGINKKIELSFRD